jgi:hypothetical protein
MLLLSTLLFYGLLYFTDSTGGNLVEIGLLPIFYCLMVLTKYSGPNSF